MPVHAAHGDVEDAVGEPADVSCWQVPLEASLRGPYPAEGSRLPVPEGLLLGEAFLVQQLALGQTRHRGRTGSGRGRAAHTGHSVDAKPTPCVRPWWHRGLRL